tara:strand:+ start:73 stop:654 length:582 start_codon:yes stop_codon:yes gene_type:complete
MKTQKAIYKMLTENTGVAMCDSGGDDGRHWQRNQKKSFKDFQNEIEISYDKDFGCTKSLFHHLNESLEYLPELTNKLNLWIARDKYDVFKNNDGRCNDWDNVQTFMEEYLYPDEKINCHYTYNEETVLSQNVQFLYGGDIYDHDIIALSIHNGADARGGLTDYKFFKVDWDCFLNYSSDYYDQDDVKQMYLVA